MSSMLNTKSLETLKQAAATLYNPALREWKKQGGKIVGYFYSYIPEEIISAAGLASFRIRGTGSTGTELSDAYFTQINCGLARHAFDLILQGEMDFIDGFVGSNICDQVRRLYDNWEALSPSPWLHFVNIPKKRGTHQTEAYLRDLEMLKEGIEDKFNVSITDEKLVDAIKLHNETRCLQRRLYELRKQNIPPLTGAETVAIMVAGTAMPKMIYNQLLRELLDEIGENEGEQTPAARLMLAVGEIDDPTFIEVIESQGGMVVTDSMLYGSLACKDDVAETGDPMKALAAYYFDGQPAKCPRIYHTSAERFDYTLKMYRDFKVDGVISYNAPFCDQWGFEQDDLILYLKDKQVPHLSLVSEYVLSGVGQVKTRVQAFLETIKEV